MISKQKARRIAYGIVARLIKDVSTGNAIGAEWLGEDAVLIAEMLGEIEAEIMKKSQ